MKYVTAIISVAMFLVCSCNSDSTVGVDDNSLVNAVDTGFVELDSSDMQTISLLEYNLNLTLKVPIVATAAGAEIRPEVRHNDGDYLWYIKIGEYFNLVIEDYANEFNKVQKHEKDLAAQKDVFTVTYLEKTPSLLFYKRTLANENGGIPTFHCFAEMEIEGYNYVLRSETFGGYETVVRDMVLSIKTAKEYKQTQKNPSASN